MAVAGAETHLSDIFYSSVRGNYAKEAIDDSNAYTTSYFLWCIIRLFDNKVVLK